VADAPATPAAALALAIEKAGSQAALARLLGVAQPSVWRWVRLGKPLPARHVLAVEAKFHISRHDLNPDIYPRPAGSPPSAATHRFEHAR